MRWPRRWPSSASAGTTPPSIPTRRGDVDADGVPDITDAIVLLGHLFLGEPRMPCFDAADADDSGALDITDAVFLLGQLFLGDATPRAPGTAFCGVDPTPEPHGIDFGCNYPATSCR